MTSNLSKNLLIAINAALKAGEEIMSIYNSKDFEVEFKNDNSPLTKADKASHNVISNNLKESPFPLLSEEGASISYDIRKNWDKFWMIDPIDGTTNKDQTGSEEEDDSWIIVVAIVVPVIILLVLVVYYFKTRNPSSQPKAQDSSSSPEENMGGELS